MCYEFNRKQRIMQFVKFINNFENLDYKGTLKLEWDIKQNIGKQLICLQFLILVGSSSNSSHNNKWYKNQVFYKFWKDRFRIAN